MAQQPENPQTAAVIQLLEHGCHSLKFIDPVQLLFDFLYMLLVIVMMVGQKII
jgi:hypothetical protein